MNTDQRTVVCLNDEDATAVLKCLGSGSDFKSRVIIDLGEKFSLTTVGISSLIA